MRLTTFGIAFLLTGCSVGLDPKYAVDPSDYTDENEETEETEEETEEETQADGQEDCTDGYDNDGDQLIDCAIQIALHLKTV